MKIELDTAQLHFLKQVTEKTTITGKDAPEVAKIMTKLDNAFNKELKKQNVKDGKNGNLE